MCGEERESWLSLSSFSFFNNITSDVPCPQSFSQLLLFSVFCFGISCLGSNLFIFNRDKIDKRATWLSQIPSLKLILELNKNGFLI